MCERLQVDLYPLERRPRVQQGDRLLGLVGIFCGYLGGKALRVRYILFPSHPQDYLAAPVPGLKSFVGLSDLV